MEAPKIVVGAPSASGRRSRPRVFVLSTEQAINEVIPKMLREHDCDVVGFDLIKNGVWVLEEAIREAQEFQPDVVFLLHNLHFLRRKAPLADPLHLLFDLLPQAKFIVGRFVDGRLCVAEETLREVTNRGYRFEFINIPFETEDLLKTVKA